MLLYEKRLGFLFLPFRQLSLPMENKRKHTFNALTAICICRTGSLCILHGFGMIKSARLVGCQFSNILLIAFMAMTRASLVLHFLFFFSPPGIGGGLLAALDLFSRDTNIQPRRLWRGQRGGSTETWICRQLQSSTLLASDVRELFLSVTCLQ